MSAGLIRDIHNMDVDIFNGSNSFVPEGSVEFRLGNAGRMFMAPDLDENGKIVIYYCGNPKNKFGSY